MKKAIFSFFLKIYVDGIPTARVFKYYGIRHNEIVKRVNFPSTIGLESLFHGHRDRLKFADETQRPSYILWEFILYLLYVAYGKNIRIMLPLNNETGIRI